MNFFLQLLLQGLALGTVYALVGQGLNVTYWTVKVVSFAHGAFMMLAAFIALTLFDHSVPLAIALLIAIVVVALLGAPLERIAVRPLLKSAATLGWVVSTLGASIVIQGIAEIIYGPQVRFFPGLFFGPTDYIRILGVQMSLQLLLVTVVTLVVLGLFELLVKFTTFGMVLKAVSYDAESARLRGIRVERVITTSFVISSGLAALAGVLIAPITGIGPSFGFSLLVSGFAAIVVGGVGSSIGALIGGITVGVAELLVGGYISTSAQGAVAFVVLISILMVKPTGLFSQNEAVKV